MTQDRPLTTLFLIQSLDGKISTGDNDSLDVDQDFKRITGVKEGLLQYYSLERQTDMISFNSGRVQEKVGANLRLWNRESESISFIVVDNKPHLDKRGVEYFAKKSKVFYLVTTNSNHPAFRLKEKYPNIKLLYYDQTIDFTDMFTRFKHEYGMEKITIQTGGTLNAVLIRLGLIDRVSIVIAPCLIGGTNTQSLIGGESLHTQKDLEKIKALKLIKCDVLKDNYLHLQYEVIQETKIEPK